MGTGPNFIKITQFHRECEKYDDIEYKILHTGQHFDKNMSDVFFNELQTRTTNNLKKLNLLDRFNSLKRINFCDPLGYLDFQKLIKNSKCVITDSGGIQEKTTFYQIPCITLRANTERPSTIELGSNTLHYFDADNIIEEFMFTFGLVMEDNYKKGKVPPLWNGKATERIM